MTWDDFTKTEKVAIFKSAITVARCNYNASMFRSLFRRVEPKHDINYAQNEYLSILLLRMNGMGDSNSLVTAVGFMQDREMADTIKQMYQEKRDFVFLIWASILCRISNSSLFGTISMSSFPSEYNSTVEAMAKDMNVTIQHTFDIDEYGFY